MPILRMNILKFHYQSQDSICSCIGMSLTNGFLVNIPICRFERTRKFFSRFFRCKCTCLLRHLFLLIDLNVRKYYKKIKWFQIVIWWLASLIYFVSFNRHQMECIIDKNNLGDGEQNNRFFINATNRQY